MEKESRSRRALRPSFLSLATASSLPYPHTPHCSLLLIPDTAVNLFMSLSSLKSSGRTLVSNDSMILYRVPSFLLSSSRPLFCCVFPTVPRMSPVAFLMSHRRVILGRRCFQINPPSPHASLFQIYPLPILLPIHEGQSCALSFSLSRAYIACFVFFLIINMPIGKIIN